MDEFFKLLIFSGMMKNITKKIFGDTKSNIDDIEDIDDIEELDLDYDEGMG